MSLSIVYLHGLFGNPSDFHEMNRMLPGVSLILPGHEASSKNDSFIVSNSRHQLNVHELLVRKLQPFTPCILIGYSMGGRMALELQRLYPHLFPKIVCLASHLGIQTEQERVKRKQWEDLWLQRIQTLSNERLFHEWYDQPLFTSFRSHPEYTKVMQKRLGVNLNQIAIVFDRTRRSQMDGIIPSKSQAFFLVGDEDKTVLNHYQDHLPQEQYCIIEKAGHCLHIENPITCVNKIQFWLES